MEKFKQSSSNNLKFKLFLVETKLARNVAEIVQAATSFAPAPKIILAECDLLGPRR